MTAPAHHIKHGNYQIEIDEPKQTKSKLWVTSAHIVHGGSKTSMSIRPAGVDGYPTREEAWEKTLAEAKRWIDLKSGR
jgi:hypothetical protein